MKITQKIKNTDYVKFAAIYFLFVSGFGFFFPYFNVYLEQNLGFSGSEIGMVISVSLLTSVAISPLWGTLADRTGKYKLILKGLLIAYACLAWLLYQSTAFFLVVIVTTVMEAVGIGMSPMLDVLAVDYCERTGKDFGRLRIAASIGWIFGSYTAGFLITTLMMDIGRAVFWPFIALLATSALIAFFIPENKNKETKKEDEPTEKPDVGLLVKNKAFLFLMLFNFLTLSLIDSVVAFSGNHLVLTLGANPSAIGWMNVVAVTPELVFFLFATRIMQRVGYKKFYMIAVVTLILRFVIYAVTTNVTLFLAAGIVGPVMMAPGVIGNFLYIKKHVPANLTGTAFMINVAILTLGRALFSLIFGVIYDVFGSFMLFKFSIVFFIIALLILIPTKHFDIFDKKEEVTQS